jgi:hypothetical protein
MNALLFDWPFAGLAASLATLLAMLLWPRPPDAPSRFRDPAWLLCLMLPVYMLHQFEEHGIDLLGDRYAFLGTMCRMLGYPQLQGCPADPAFIFAVNVGAVWIAGACAIIWRRSNPLVGACAWGIALVNGVVHLGGALRLGGYNPGLLTGLLLLVPLSLWVLRTLLRSGKLQVNRVPVVIASGVLIHVVLIAALRATAQGELTPTTDLVIQTLNGLVPLALGILFAMNAPRQSAQQSAP